MTKIIVTHEDGGVEEHRFDDDARVIGIGRRAGNEVCISDRSVSGLHARVTFDDGAVWIEDLNSTNGTYVNGLLVSRRRLEDGDEILLGKIRLAFSRSSDVATTLAAVPAAGAEAEAASVGGAGAQARTAAAAPSLAPVAAAAAPSVESAVVPAREAEPAGEAAPRPASRPRLQAVGPPARDAARPHPLDGLDTALVERREDRGADAGRTAQGAVIEIKNGAKCGQVLPIDKPVTTLGRPGIQIAAIMRKPDGYFLMHIESDDSIARPTLNKDSIGDEPVLLHSGDELNVAGIDVQFVLP